MESEKLKGRVKKLEGENGRLRCQLAAYVPAVSGLNDSITAFEMKSLGQVNPHNYKVLKVIYIIYSSGNQPLLHILY